MGRENEDVAGEKGEERDLKSCPPKSTWCIEA